MAAVNSLVLKVEEVHRILEEKKVAEKAQIGLLTELSLRLFKESVQEYDTLQALSSTAQSEEHQHAQLATMLAEAALRTDHIELARSFAERFFQMSPQKDQYFCRMKVVLGLVIHSENVDKNGQVLVSQCKKATEEILQAVDIALLPNNLPRYKFIVYNASLALWSVVKKFVRSGRGQSFASDMNRIIAALEQLDDADKYWRILMLAAGSTCAEDEKNVKNASDHSDKAISLLEGLLNVTLSEEAQLVAVSDSCKAEVDTAMAAFRAIEDREELLRKPRKIDPDLPDDDEYYTAPLVLPPLEGLALQGRENVKSLLDSAQGRKANIELKLRAVVERRIGQSEYQLRLYRQRVVVAPADLKKLISLPQVVKDARLFCMIQLQGILSNAVGEKEVDATWSSCVKKLQDAPASESRSETLLDFSRTAWLLKQVPLAKQCMDLAQKSTQPITRVLRAKLDICEVLSQLHSIDSEVQDSVARQLLSGKQVDGLRATKQLEAVKKLERTLTTTAMVLGDKFLVVDICVILWNALLPFLSKNLRPKVHSPLRSIATALEDLEIDVVPILRSQVHYELALAEEAADFAGIAQVETQKAYALDFGGTSQPNPTDAVRPLDSDELNPNRLSDQYMTPLLRLLSLRVDVYATPTDPSAQALLWLQQAQESTAKPFIRDMITKTMSLVLEDIDPSGAADSHAHDGVDWSLVLMKRAPIRIPDVTVDELTKTLAPTATPSLQTAFSFRHQRYVQILQSLCRLSFLVQDTTIFLQAYTRLMGFAYQVGDAFAYEFIDGQIDASCKFAEVMVWRIQQLGRTGSPTAGLPLLWQESAQSFALGTQPQIPDLLIGKRIDVTPLTICKLVVLQALSRAFQLALSRKNSYLVHNVLIYFWNLHLHLFRDDGNAQLRVALDDTVQFLQVAVSSIETVLLPNCANIRDCCDLRLLGQYYEALSRAQECRNQRAEALATLQKGVQVVFPTVSSASTTATYFKKQLVERASRLGVENALAGVASAATDVKGKGGGKGGAVPAVEPLAVPENPWLSCFSALAVAEYFGLMQDATGASMNIPTDVLVGAMEKALRTLQTEVSAAVDKEKAAESSGAQLRTKESVDQRLELWLECYARLARLKTMHGDFIAAQDLAEAGIHVFQETLQSCYPNISGANGNGGSITINSSDSEGPSVTVRSWRWMACCELGMSLAVISFLESAKAASGASTLDESLQLELQRSSFHHLLPALRYATYSREEEMLQRGLSLMAQILPPVLEAEESFRETVDLMTQMLKQELASQPRSLSTQRMLQCLYVSVVNALISSQFYDEALKLLKHAFEKLDKSLHQALWPGRVICMSRKGMNVLDGLQKLKETDPKLQAQVLVLYARSTQDLGIKISVYQQALQLLDGHIERVEYLLELAEVMSVYGVPRSEIRQVLGEGLNTIGLVEEELYTEIREWTADDDDYANEDEFDESASGVRARSSATSIQQVHRSQSATSKSRRGVTPSETQSQSQLGARTKSAASQKSGSVRGGGGSAGPPPARTLPVALTLKHYDLALRLCTLQLRTALGQRDQVQHALHAFYFTQRMMQRWLGALRNCHRRTQYLALDAEVRATTPFETYTPADAYPAHLRDWVSSDPAADASAEVFDVVFGWEHDLVFAQYAREQLQDYQQRLKQSQTDSGTAQMMYDHAQFLEDVPSLQSLCAYSATVHHLFALIEHFQTQLRLPYHALYVIKVARLLLWTMPCVATNIEDRQIALTVLHLRYQDICASLGLPNNNKQRFPCEVFVADFNNTSVLSSTSAVSVSTFLRKTLQQWSEQHLQADIAEGQRMDVLLQDLFSHIQRQKQENTPAGSSNRPNPFQIESTMETPFQSLTRLESEVFWLQAIRLLHRVGEFAVAEEVAVSFLWQQRFQRQVRYTVEAVVCFLELQLLRGVYQDVHTQALRYRQLLGCFGDIQVLQPLVHQLVRSLQAQGDEQEALQTATMFHALLEDMALRSLQTAPATGVNSVLVTALLNNNGGNNKNNNKPRTTAGVHSSTSTLQQSNAQNLGQGSALTLRTAGTAGTSANTARAWSAEELGVEYLTAWRHNVEVLARLHVERGLRRCTGLLTRQSTSSFLMEDFDHAMGLLQHAQSVLRQVQGPESVLLFELLAVEVALGQRFLAQCHKAAVHLITDADAWCKRGYERLQLCADEMETIAVTWSQNVDITRSSNAGANQVGSSSGAVEPAADGTDAFPVLSFTNATPASGATSSTPTAWKSLLAEAYLRCALIRCHLQFLENSGKVSSTSNANNGNANAVERYLQETDMPELASTINAFAVPRWQEVLMYAERARDLYRDIFTPASTGNGGGGLRCASAEVLLYAARLALYGARGVGRGGSDEAATRGWLQSLQQLLMQGPLVNAALDLVDTDDEPFVFDASVYGACMLLESLLVFISSNSSSGNSTAVHADSATAFAVGAQLQAWHSQRWLKQVWTQSLSAQSDMSIALRRLYSLVQGGALGGGAQRGVSEGRCAEHSAAKAWQREQQFLRTISTAYRRMWLREDMTSTIDQLQPLLQRLEPTSQVLLQLSPFGHTVYYLSCTPTAPAPAAAAPNAKAAKDDPANSAPKSAYLVEKRAMALGERVSLSQAVQSMRQWTLDCSKTVAMYGEQVNAADFMISINNTVSETTAPNNNNAAVISDAASVAGSVASAGAASQSSWRGGSTAQKAFHAVDAAFQALVQSLDLLLRTLPRTPPQSTPSGVLLCVDVSLAELPWESLGIWGDQRAGTQTPPPATTAAAAIAPPRGGVVVSRDWSLGFLAQRLGLSGSGSAPAVPPPTDVTASGMRFALDVFKEDAGQRVANATTRAPLREVLAQTLKTVPGGAKMQPLLRSASAEVCAEDFVQQLDASGRWTLTAQPQSRVSVFVQVLGRALALLSPADLAQLSCEKVVLALMVDQAHNDASYRRQASAEVLLSAQELLLQRSSLLGAALWSLSGVTSYSGVLYSTPVVTQEVCMREFWRRWAMPATAAAAAGGKGAATAGAVKAGVARAYLEDMQPQQAQQPQQVMKRWVVQSRVVYGAHNLTYSEA